MAPSDAGLLKYPSGSHGGPENNDSSLDSISIRRTTGNYAMDIALDRALKRIADSFNVFPGFGFVDDTGRPNAWASPETVIPNTKGTVVFGYNYFSKWMNYDPTGLSVIATLAHEFGHIMQFDSGLYEHIKGGLPTSKRTELHADYMSGYYLGLLKKKNSGASFWKAGDKFRQIGSYDEQKQDFHGTPEQRIAASQQGFNVGFFEQRDAKFAFQTGIDYVSRR